MTNAFTGVAGEGKDPLDGETRPFPEIAEHLARRPVCAWCVGRRRELRRRLVARARGDGAAVIAAGSRSSPVSFARIHETNLKKQGMLPLTFADPATYDEIGEDDSSRARPGRDRPGRAVPRAVTKSDGDVLHLLLRPHPSSAEGHRRVHAGARAT